MDGTQNPEMQNIFSCNACGISFENLEDFRKHKDKASEADCRIVGNTQNKSTRNPTEACVTSEYMTRSKQRNSGKAAGARGKSRLGAERSRSRTRIVSPAASSSENEMDQQTSDTVPATGSDTTGQAIQKNLSTQAHASEFNEVWSMDAASKFPKPLKCHNCTNNFVDLNIFENHVIQCNPVKEDFSSVQSDRTSPENVHLHEKKDSQEQSASSIGNKDPAVTTEMKVKGFVERRDYRAIKELAGILASRPPTEIIDEVRRILAIDDPETIQILKMRIYLAAGFLMKEINNIVKATKQRLAAETPFSKFLVSQNRSLVKSFTSAMEHGEKSFYTLKKARSDLENAYLAANYPSLHSSNKSVAAAISDHMRAAETAVDAAENAITALITVVTGGNTSQQNCAEKEINKEICYFRESLEKNRSLLSKVLENAALYHEIIAAA